METFADMKETLMSFVTQPLKYFKTDDLCANTNASTEHTNNNGALCSLNYLDSEDKNKKDMTWSVRSFENPNSSSLMDNRERFLADKYHCYNKYYEHTCDAHFIFTVSNPTVIRLVQDILDNPGLTTEELSKRHRHKDVRRTLIDSSVKEQLRDGSLELVRNHYLYREANGEVTWKVHWLVKQIAWVQ